MPAMGLRQCLPFRFVAAPLLEAGLGPEAVGGGCGGEDEECGEGGGPAEVEGQAGDAGLEAEP